MKSDENTKIEPKQNGSTVLDINLNDFIFTPLACASLVNEILKGLVYQKCQIPYPFTWLKTVVNKKRTALADGEGINKRRNLNVENHFKTVSQAYDTLDEIMKAIVNEFKIDDSDVKELVILFGTSPHCPKEVYTIRITSLDKGHCDRNHASRNSKSQQKILRSIFLSQTWMDAIDSSLTCTNTYIFVKKRIVQDITNSRDNFFIPSRPPVFSTKTKHTILNFHYECSYDHPCCSNLSVFEDNGIVSGCSQSQISECGALVNSEDGWYQSKTLLKGFKDCYINNVSACELW